MGVHDRIGEQGRHLTTTSGELPFVAWWHGTPGRITSWLLVGPPPAPLTDEAWVHQLALTRRAGEWAVASQPPLGPLPDQITQRLHDPLGAAADAQSAVLDANGELLPGTAADELRAECVEAALDLVAGRLEQPIDPKQSGILLLRLRTDGTRAYLDLAPARDEDGWLGRSVIVDLRGATLRWADASAPIERAGESFVEGSVSLGGRTLDVPIASLELAVPDGAIAAGQLCAAVDVTLPTLVHAHVPEPVVTLELETSHGLG